jgi:ribonuclease HI
MSIIDNSETLTKTVDVTPRGCIRQYRPTAGWGCVLRYGSYIKSINGSAVSKSERRMELLALLNGLKQLKYPCQVKLYTGTEYISDCATQLIRRRRSSVFLATVQAGTAKNADLWREFQTLTQKHHIMVIWVAVRSRHADDSAARSAARWAA